MAKGKKPRVTVVKETPSGRNDIFKDNKTGQRMNRPQFVEKIKTGQSGLDDDYYVAKRGGVDTPISKPDGDPSNNLG